MNTAQLKIISWSLATLFGAGLAAYVGDYLMHRDAREKRVTKEEVTGLLENVPPIEKKADDIVAYERVNQSLNKYNWTGKAPPKIVEQPKVVETKAPGTEPVSSLLKVLLVKSDSSDDSGSRAVIKYLPAAKVSLKDPTVVKHVGDTLDAPNEWVMVAAIVPEGVRFKFADAARAEELVKPIEFEKRLDMDALVNRGGSSIPKPTEVLYPRTRTAGDIPERTQLVGDGIYQIGSKDMEEWDERYEQYLSEVELGRHRDPTTGKYDGIALSSVPANSVAAAHGAKEGDVIKSINGHPVNSTQEAISFVKNNKDKYDVWDVEVDSKGKIHTITYKVKKKK